MKKKGSTTPKIVVEEMIPLAEMQELMDEHCSEIPWVGNVPTLAETNYLAEENDENPPTKKSGK